MKNIFPKKIMPIMLLQYLSFLLVELSQLACTRGQARREVDRTHRTTVLLVLSCIPAVLTLLSVQGCTPQWGRKQVVRIHRMAAVHIPTELSPPFVLASTDRLAVAG